MGLDPGERPDYLQVLDEMAATGYAGTELGDRGFMPDEPQTLRAELSKRNLAMVGAFVPVALASPTAASQGLADGLRAARLLAACAGARSASSGPFVILADSGDATRLKFAGRIGPEHGWSPDQWRSCAGAVRRIAEAVRDETGLRTAFHHHSATYVETPVEVETLLDQTPPDLLGLCLDTAHYAYGGGDPLDALRRFGERVWHVHFKDCDTEVVARARAEGWDYLEALRRGIFCDLGTGGLDFPSLLAELQRQGYEGWIVVENESPSGGDTPPQKAQRDRDYLRELGL
ncbi:MAG: TIM barrel protein [Chloroflexi bacterium]|nr:TIM barrel protein [Chloroflexota bacterium]